MQKPFAGLLSHLLRYVHGLNSVCVQKIHTALLGVENNKIPENCFPFELGSSHSGVQELSSGSS